VLIILHRRNNEREKNAEKPVTFAVTFEKQFVTNRINRGLATLLPQKAAVTHRHAQAGI
jgi:hypothetical protein